MGDVSYSKGPIFVVGMPRSGTTLIRVMLSSHPRITISPETHYLSIWMRRLAHLDVGRSKGSGTFWHEFVQTDRFSHLDIDPDTTRTRILGYGPVTHRTIFTGLMEEFAGKMRKPRWGEKTPRHYRHIDTLLEWFPNARVVYLVRDPRAVVSSMLATPWGGRDTEKSVQEWLQCLRIMGKWEKDERVHVVAYEQLVSDPQQQLRRMCRFLDEEYSPAMLTRLGAGLPVANREEWAREALEASLEPITLDSITKWRSNLSGYQVAVIEHMARREMLSLGYQPITKHLTPVQFARLHWHALICLVRRVARKLLRITRASGRRSLSAMPAAKAASQLPREE